MTSKSNNNVIVKINNMKSLLTIPLFILCFALSNCASKAPSSKLLQLAKPVEVEAPSTAVIENKVRYVSQTVDDTSKDLDEANKSLVELEKQVIESGAINEDFKKAIEALSIESQAAIDTFRVRYQELATRSKKTIADLKNDLNNALFKIADLKVQVDQLEEAVYVHKNNTAEALKETERLRELYSEVTKMRVKDESYKDKAESRKKYVWITWGLVALIGVSVFLQMRFRIL